MYTVSRLEYTPLFDDTKSQQGEQMQKLTGLVFQYSSKKNPFTGERALFLVHDVSRPAVDPMRCSSHESAFVWLLLFTWWPLVLRQGRV